MKKQKSFTLIETLIVVAIFMVFILIIFQFVTVTQRTREIQEDKVTEQLEAQKAMHNIVSRLKLSGSGWTDCPVSTTDGLEFCYPVFTGNTTFYEDTDIIDTYRVKFYYDDVNRRLIMSQKDVDGNTELSPVGSSVKSVTFSCNAGDCSTIQVDIITEEENEYAISTKVELRNTKIEDSMFNFPASEEEGEEGGEEGSSGDIEG